MAGITQEQAETRLTEYMTAEQTVLSNQSYTIAGRTLTRANLREIRDGITFWETKVKRLTRGGLKMRFGTPS